MQITITFSKLGRGDDVPAPLVLTEPQYFTDDGRPSWDVVAARAEQYSRPHLKSKMVDVVIGMSGDGPITGLVVVGGTRPVGMFDVAVADA